jgi:hypothetical protein
VLLSFHSGTSIARDLTSPCTSGRSVDGNDSAANPVTSCSPTMFPDRLAVTEAPRQVCILLSVLLACSVISFPFSSAFSFPELVRLDCP